MVNVLQVRFLNGIRFSWVIFMGKGVSRMFVHCEAWLDPPPLDQLHDPVLHADAQDGQQDHEGPAQVAQVGGRVKNGHLEGEQEFINLFNCFENSLTGKGTKV